MVRIVVIVALVLIVISLGTALYYLYHDRGEGTKQKQSFIWAHGSSSSKKGVG